MQQHGNKYFAPRPPPSNLEVNVQLFQKTSSPSPQHTHLEWGQKAKIIFFLEHGHAAYQIKGNR